MDELIGGCYFQYTAEVWKPLEALEEPTLANGNDENEMLTGEWRRWSEKVKVMKEEAFPYLDMQMSRVNNILQFSVYSKESQTIKYVDKESCHWPSVFKAIPAGNNKKNPNT
eukprot:7654706-Ditylum_brightwellii.AAC.1